MTGRGRAADGRMKPVAAVAAAVTAGAIAAITTAPWRFSGPPSWESCGICGSIGGADAVLNVLLFVPLGYLLVRAGMSWPRSVLVAVLASAAIEALQSFQPARFATWGDLVANTTGAAAGAAAARFGAAAAARARRGGIAVAVMLALPGALVLLATAWLFQPSLPDSTYYGQWTPDLGHFGRFPGRVLDAWVGRVPVQVGRLEDNTPVRSGLAGTDPVRVMVQPAGRPPGEPSPIFSIFDGDQREVLFLGAAGDDALARVRTRAAELGFRPPFAVAPGLLAGLSLESPAVLRWSERGSAGCLGWDDREVCGIRPPLSRGWALVLPVRAGSGASLADGIWLALLFAPLGCGGRPADTIFGAALLMGLAMLIPRLAPVGTVPVAAWFAAASAALVGWLLIWAMRAGTGRGSKA